MGVQPSDTTRLFVRVVLVFRRGLGSNHDSCGEGFYAFRLHNSSLRANNFVDHLKPFSQQLEE